MKDNDLKVIYGKKSQKTHDTIFVREEDFEVPHGEDYKLAIKVLDRIQESIIEEKPLPHNFVYDTTSLWWFIYQSLVADVKRSTNFISGFSELLKSINPSTVIIEDDFSKLGMIKQICSINKVRLKYSLSKFFIHKLQAKTINLIQSYRYKKITNSKIKKRLNIFNQNDKKLPPMNDKILFAISTNFRRSIFDFEKKKTTRGEFIQKTIMDMLDKKKIVGIDLDYTFHGQPEILAERLGDEIPWVPVESIIQNFKVKTSHKNFLQHYKKLLKKYEFQSLFRFNDVSFWNEVKESFSKMMSFPYLPFYLILLDGLLEFFSKNKPNAIFLPYETGPLALAFISVFKKLKIKSIGVQHGYIYPESPMYSQTKFASNDHPYGFPLPDQTLLFGQYVKDLLVSKGYPTNQLVVFGNPSLFNLEKITTEFSMYNLKKKFAIVENQKVILFTTGKLQRNYPEAGRYDYDEQIWNTLLKNFGNNEEFMLILKPHPSEENTSVYEEILKNHNCSNAIISKEDIFELIHIASIVVSVFSSTMFDALCFKKPVFRVKFDNDKPHLLDNSGGVITSNLADLSRNILNIIRDEELLLALQKKISSFVKEHYGIPETQPQLTLKKVLEN